MDPVQAYKTLGIALALGLLVGLQRGRGSGHIAGLRTFPLIAVLGAISAMLVPTLGVWMPAVTLLGVIAMVISGEFIKSRDEPDPGITTDISILIMFIAGAMLAFVISMDDFIITLMVSGAGSTTLPVYIYSMIRRGLTPEINAVSTLLLLFSVAIVTAYWIVSNKTQTETVH